MKILPDPRIKYYIAGVLAPGRQPTLSKGQLKLPAKLQNKVGLKRTKATNVIKNVIQKLRKMN
jgi:hypothetical protein